MHDSQVLLISLIAHYILQGRILEVKTIMNFDFDYFCGVQYAITYLYVIFVKRNILIQIFSENLI